MSSSPPTKDIANTVYHAAVTTALAVLYSMFGKKIIRLDVGDPARPYFTEYIKYNTKIYSLWRHCYEVHIIRLINCS